MTSICKLSTRILLSIVVIFALWSLMDFLIHGLWLGEAYRETANLWRPCSEMKMGLMHLLTLLIAFPFTMGYVLLVQPKTICRGVRWGVVIGIITGIGFGFGSYAVMPIPVSLAWAWFFGTVIEYGLAGLVLGLMIKIPSCEESSSKKSCCAR